MINDEGAVPCEESLALTPGKFTLIQTGLSSARISESQCIVPETKP